jgi:hypothetical protein
MKHETAIYIAAIVGSLLTAVGIIWMCAAYGPVA